MTQVDFSDELSTALKWQKVEKKYLYKKSIDVLDFLSEVVIKLKSDSHLPKNDCFVCFNESPLKMMKNAFCFILKPLFLLKAFQFFVSKDNQTRKFHQIIEYNNRKIFLQKSSRK